MTPVLQLAALVSVFNCAPGLLTRPMSSPLVIGSRLYSFRETLPVSNRTPRSVPTPLTRILDRLEDRIVPSIDITTTWRPLDFTYSGSFSGTTSVPGAWFGDDYLDTFTGTVSGAGRVTYTNQSNGTSGTISGNGGGSGSDNCGPYTFAFTGSSTLADVGGAIATDTAGGSDQYQYSSPNGCGTGGGEVFQQSGGGTFSPSNYLASISWSNPVSGGGQTGTTSGQFSGSVTQTATEKTDLTVMAGPATATEFGFILEVTGKLMTADSHGKAVTQVGLYWAKQPSLDKLIGPAREPIPVYWNQGRIEVTGVTLADLSPRPEDAYLVAVVDAGRAVEEADERNNLVVLGADLAIVEIGDPETVRYPEAKGVWFEYEAVTPQLLLNQIVSQKQTAHLYVVNRGIFPAEPVEMVFFSSESPTYNLANPTYRELGFLRVPRLQPGEVFEVEAKELSNPIFLTKVGGESQYDGPYFQGVHLDPANRVFESKENNNTDAEDACELAPVVATFVEAGALFLDAAFLFQSGAAAHFRHFLGRSGAPYVWNPTDSYAMRAREASQVQSLVNVLGVVASRDIRDEYLATGAATDYHFAPADLRPNGVTPVLDDTIDLKFATNGTQGGNALLDVVAYTERIANGRRVLDYSAQIHLVLQDSYDFDRGDAATNTLDYFMRYLQHCNEAEPFPVIINFPAFPVQGSIDLGPATSEPPPPPISFAPSVMPGRGSRVTVRNGDGSARFTITAYDPSFTGGVRTAQGDVNGDGVRDLVTGAGAGGGPHVRVFNGVDGSELASFFAYDNGFRGGVFVTLVDVDGDGRAEVVTGAGAGGGPHVRVFHGLSGTEQGGFFAAASDGRGGVTVAGGDVNGDGRADLVTGIDAQVRTFDGRSFAPLGSFAAYNGFGGGVHVLSGDFDGDGRAEVVTGAGAGGGPHVRVFRAGGEELTGMFPFAAESRSGVDVALIEVGGRAALLGRHADSPHVVRILDALTLGDRAEHLGFDPLVLNAVALSE